MAETAVSSNIPGDTVATFQRKSLEKDSLQLLEINFVFGNIYSYSEMTCTE